jgi:hypothetical protein
VVRWGARSERLSGSIKRQASRRSAAWEFAPGATGHLRSFYCNGRRPRDSSDPGTIQGCFVLTLGKTKGTGSRAQRSACPLCLAQSHSVVGNGDRHLPRKWEQAPGRVQPEPVPISEADRVRNDPGGTIHPTNRAIAAGFFGEGHQDIDSANPSITPTFEIFVRANEFQDSS